MDKRRVLVVGGGGREHALLWKLSQSPRVAKLFAAPGNGGTRLVAENIEIEANDIDGLLQFVISNEIDLTIVGPDDPLASGIVDRFKAKGLKIFGPTQSAAQIEASKAFSKQLMWERQIPTPRYQTFASASLALEYIKDQPLPVVVKASGLALGKGVTVCQTQEEAEATIHSIMIEKIFGSAGSQVVIEEFISGAEVSLHAICDGRDFILFPSSQDHKPVGDGDSGPNTGGMGTIAPIPWLSPADIEQLGAVIVRPTLRALAQGGRSFSGCLYPGVMITETGPKVFEFNARFGDPEAQVYMRLLDSDLLDMIDASLERRLDRLRVKWKKGFAACIVLASGGYPGSYQKGKAIEGLEQAVEQEDVVIYHAGTDYKDGQYLTNGGRVLNLTAIGPTLQEALDKAYAAAKLIKFDGVQYRRDIGKKALELSEIISE